MITRSTCLQVQAPAQVLVQVQVQATAQAPVQAPAHRLRRQ